MDMLRLDPSRALGGEVELTEEHRRALEQLLARRARDCRWLDTDVLAAGHEELVAYAESLRGRVHTLVVLCIGASALPVQALRTALNSPFHNMTMPGGLPRLIVLDNLDPDLIGEFLDCVDPSECWFQVVSRSGESVATLAQFSIMRDELARRLGPEAHKERVAITTNAHSGPLHRIAQEEGYASFPIPDGVQGRFAALSAVGLLPAAMLGIDTPGLLAGARDMAQLATHFSAIDNPALAYAALQQRFAQQGRTLAVHASLSHRLRDLGAYAAQLGGSAMGLPGVLDRHNQLEPLLQAPQGKWFSLLDSACQDHQLELPGGGSLNALFADERQAGLDALQAAGIPLVRVLLPRVNAHALGQYFQFQQTAAALASELGQR